MIKLNSKAVWGMLSSWMWLRNGCRFPLSAKLIHNHWKTTHILKRKTWRIPFVNRDIEFFLKNFLLIFLFSVLEAEKLFISNLISFPSLKVMQINVGRINIVQEIIYESVTFNSSPVERFNFCWTFKIAEFLLFLRQLLAR